MLKARIIYLEKYKVDICRVVSAPSLSLLIFRRTFLTEYIPILGRKLDSVIRPSYFGGSTDFYTRHASNVKYYDVNSLYPFAMLNDMPGNYLGMLDVNTNLDEVFGFVEVIVSAPSDMTNPILIHHYNDSTIHPVGTWKATYFSEELKAVLKHGYKIEQVLNIYSFSRISNLFKDYIDHFYELKKVASEQKDETMRQLAKLHLNTLYGMFGKEVDILKSIISAPSEEKDIVSHYSVNSMIKISDVIRIFLVNANVDFDLMKRTNQELNINLLMLPFQIIKTNVAIASAITAYARMEMFKYKTIPGQIVHYTDTDSIFTNKELPAELVGEDLGLMKDELAGDWIKEAYFFGKKQYAYIDNNDNVKSVFSGVVRNSLSWSDVQTLHNGNKITKILPDQFLHSKMKLEILIKSRSVNIQSNSEKELVDNFYKPLVINDVSHNKLIDSTMNFINSTSRWISRIKQSLG